MIDMSNWRIHFVFFIILLAGAGIMARLFYIQVIENGYYAAFAKGQQSDYMEISPQRGSIFFQDKFNKSSLFPAASYKNWFMAYAVPKEMDNTKDAILKLLPILNASSTEEFAADLEIRLGKKDDPYEPIMSRLNEEQAETIDSLELTGIHTRKENLRHYPGGELASHVLGFVGYSNEERLGQYGVEGFYDDILKGNKDLILTIDYNIQFMLENKLRAAKEKFAADSASAVVMNPKNGEIIALAITDSFDPNNYSQVKNIDMFLNDAVQKIFEPGSTFKPFTVAAALDVGAITPTAEYVDKGYIQIWDRTFKNSNERVYGRQNMTNVLEFSINTGAVFIEQKLGHDSFREYIHNFGFGERTGVDLQGEVSGDIQNILRTSRDVNFATASFGQGLAVTPLQLIVAFSSFANGGKMVKPHVLKELEPEIIGEPISAKTAAQMTEMLVSVVENGYAKKAAVKGYKVAGKTGTAQVPNKDTGGYSDKTIHSFVGFAPAYDPRFIALIKLDNPKGINFSESSVAPIFSQVAEYILNYYEIPPDS